jgi:hypothetical protein
MSGSAAGLGADDEWIGGQSETLKISSRDEKDQTLIASMLASPARETWDLVTRLVEQEPGPVLEILFPAGTSPQRCPCIRSYRNCLIW